MTKALFRFHLLVFVTLSSLSWPAGYGQGTTSNILGSVLDQSRAVLPGVTISATSLETGQRRETVTDEQGRYTIAQLRIGRYSLEAQLPGFQSAKQEVTLTVGTDAVINFMLRVGGEQTELTITSETPLIETANASFKGLVDEQQIRDLPLNGRSFTDLASLQAGVVINYNQGKFHGLEGTAIFVGGTRGTNNSYQLDGTEIKNQRSMTPGSIAGVLLGVDTVREFSVIIGIPNAEYGAFSGGIINAITRSGTNEFHGTIFEFHRNSALDARNFFDRDPRDPGKRSDPPEFKRNQYGFTLGGPIARNKAFFFGSFEGFNQRLSTTETRNVPSLNARQGILANGRVVTPSLVTKSLLDLYPRPNGQNFGDIAEYIYENPRRINEYYFILKLDWELSQNDAIGGRYVLDDAEQLLFPDVGGGLDLMTSESTSRSQYAMVEWRRVISPNLVNEARVSLNRNFNQLDNLYTSQYPSIMIFNPLSVNYKGSPRYGAVGARGVEYLAQIPFFTQKNVPNRFQYIDNLSYTTGGHSFKMGANIHRLQLNFDGPFSEQGQYQFASVADMVANAPPFLFIGAITKSIPRGMRQTMLGFYGQDDWRVTQRLTLNLGVRWEPYTKPTEVYGRLGNIRNPAAPAITAGNPLFTVNPSWDNFSPRAGLAWDPFGNGKTAIRVGYGLFYELVNWPHYFAAGTQAPPLAISVTLVCPFPGFFQCHQFPNFRSVLPADVSRIPTSPFVFSDTLKQSGVHRYEASIQQELLPDLVLKVAYLGSKGYNLAHTVDRNSAIPTADAQGRYPFWPANAQRRYSQFGQIRDLAWDADSWYNALGVDVRKRFRQGYALQASYTWSKNLDEASAVTVFDGGQVGSVFPEDVNIDKALSSFDIRNRLSINGSWDLPFGRGRSVGKDWLGPVNAILGGWTMNGILTASDGNHATLSLGFNNSRSAQTVDIPDRPDLIPGGDNSPVLSDGRDPNKYFDPLQFVAGPAGYLGNLARNTLETPGVLAVDFSIFKNFSFSEERFLQFRAEMFNIANRANFASPATATYLSGPQQTPQGIIPAQRNPTAGVIRRTTTTSRQIQFALKYHF
ncbi:MAG: TonB-dependent receptor [Acidobacteria bacterium]|nr:TonB-dependent receptor [Acidobacteriota bacterium]